MFSDWIWQEPGEDIMHVNGDAVKNELERILKEVIGVQAREELTWRPNFSPVKNVAVDYFANILSLL